MWVNGLESTRPGSTRPGSTRPGQISAWSRIKPTFSMLAMCLIQKVCTFSSPLIKLIKSLIAMFVNYKICFH